MGPSGVVAFYLMMNNSSRFEAILSASRAGDESAFACAVIKERLPKLLGPEEDVGRGALAVLASEVSLFGLQPKLIFVLPCAGPLNCS